ncbi:unnamed protein product, partial [Staurois parvus]
MSPPPQSHQSLYRGAYTLMSPPPTVTSVSVQRSLHSNVPLPHSPISLCTEELTLYVPSPTVPISLCTE